VIAGPDACELGDPAHGVRVGDEVLAEVAAWREAMIVEHFADGRARVRQRAGPFVVAFTGSTRR